MIRSIALVAVLCTLVGSARADLVSIEFTGTLSQAYHQHTGVLLPGYTGVGQTYSGVFTFNDQAPYIGPGQTGPNYAWTGASLSVDIGGFVYGFTQVPNPNGETVTLPSIPNAGHDVIGNIYAAEQDTNSNELTSNNEFGFYIQTTLQTLSLSDIKNLPMSDFVGSPGGVLLEDELLNEADSFQIEGNITSFTGLTVVPSAPGPPSLLLVAFPSLLAVADFIRRRMA